jgi:hypothetical protein
MKCTKCNEPIEEKSGYFRTKRGAHHFKCGLANLADQPRRRVPNEVIEKMIEIYDRRGASESKFEAMVKCANLARTVIATA